MNFNLDSFSIDTLYLQSIHAKNKLLIPLLLNLQDGPPVAEIVSVIGKEAAIQRLQRTIDILNSLKT